MRKTITFALILCVMLAALVSCSNDAVETFGRLEITIDSDVSRGLEPVSMETKSYNVTVMDSTGSTVFTSNSSAKTSYTTSVPIGNCTVNVEALNKTGDVIGSGYASCEIRAGQSNTITVRVTEPSGDGTFSMSIRGKSGNSLSYVIKDASLTTIRQGSLTYSESTGKYTASETLSNGFYYFSILWNEADEPVRTETIRVVKGKTISYEAEFLFLIDGTLSITNEIIGTPTIVLNRSSRALTASKTLTVSAEISGIRDYTCFWSVDDKPLSGLQAYADLELPMAGLAEGEHTVALVVSDGNIIWSESAGFAVLPDRPTELEVSGDVELWVIGDVLIPYQLRTTVRFGNRYTRSFTTMGHRYESLGNESVILSCSLDRDDYTYYLDTEYDSANNRTVVYVVIDQYIEDPAYLEVTLDKETEFGEWGTFGVYLMASNHEISPNEKNSNRRRWGLVPFTDDNMSRTIKVPADTYSYNGNDWNNINNYFYVVADRNSVTLTSGQTKQINFTEGDYAYITIQLPDTYADGTEFYNGYTTSNSKINITVRPGWDYSYTLYPRYEKDCYYTVSFNEPAGNHTVTALRHDSSFVNTNYSVSAGNTLLTVVSDCMVPEDMVFQCRIGEYYTDINRCYDYAYRNYSMNVPSQGTLEVWSTYPDDYYFTASTSTTDNGQTLILLKINAAYDDYATLNLTYDFEFDLTNSTRSIRDCTYSSDSNNGVWYDLFIVDKSITQVKVLPGSYQWSSGNWGPSLVNRNGETVSPYIQPGSFSISAGETKNITIGMQHVEVEN